MFRKRYQPVKSTVLRILAELNTNSESIGSIDNGIEAYFKTLYLDPFRL